jgi:hypothetical protein
MLKVKKIGYGCSADGQIVTLSFADERGKTSTIALDSDHVSNLYLRLEEAAEYAREKAVHSNKGVDPRILHPVHAKTVTGFGGAVAEYLLNPPPTGVDVA